ncbi:DUF1488 family protein [Agrobacterium tumefaciens]|uniref:DUF1488 family protein n=1 Tax=Agrobacterium tumefaciens TaxID=358 RepID=UPI003D6F7711
MFSIVELRFFIEAAALGQSSSSNISSECLSAFDAARGAILEAAKRFTRVADDLCTCLVPEISDEFGLAAPRNAGAAARLSPTYPASPRVCSASIARRRSMITAGQNGTPLSQRKGRDQGSRVLTMSRPHG